MSQSVSFQISIEINILTLIPTENVYCICEWCGIVEEKYLSKPAIRICPMLRTNVRSAGMSVLATWDKPNSDL